MVAKLDKFGRILIPKKIREDLRISQDSQINIINDGNRIIIEPIEEQTALIEKNNLLVYTGKISSIEVDDEIKKQRAVRLKKMI